MPRCGIQRTQTIDQQTGDFAVSALRANLGPQHTASLIPKETGSDRFSPLSFFQAQKNLTTLFTQVAKREIGRFRKLVVRKGGLEPPWPCDR